MYDRDLKHRRTTRSSKRIAELFVCVEEQINTRKALSKGDVCTLSKCVEQKFNYVSGKDVALSDEQQSKK